jgi:O-antigen biosynthesis protein
MKAPIFIGEFELTEPITDIRLPEREDGLAVAGEDVDMFMRVILAGHRLAYEPSAVVWHVHRAELSQLSRQMTAYGPGCTAALTAMVMRNPRVLLELAARTARGVQRITAIGSRVKGDPALPSGLMRREVRGMLAGPWLYVKGRRRLRRQPEELRGPYRVRDQCN